MMDIDDPKVFVWMCFALLIIGMYLGSIVARLEACP